MAKARSKFPFSTKRLRELPAPKTGREYHYDDRTPGLSLCVTHTGTRTFYYCKFVDGKATRVRLGKFTGVSIDGARKAAAEMAGEVAKGRDPAAERRARRETPTLQDLFDYWLEIYAKQHKRTWREDVRKFKKYFGSLNRKRLSAIDQGVVQKWHSGLGKQHGPYLANRARALLSAMWGSAGKLGHHVLNPCAGVKKFREESRERFLQPAEMKTFFTALKAEEPVWRDFFLLCLFTGARRGNVAAMEWSEIDLDNGAWHITGQKTKGGLPLVVVLPDPAQVVLRSRLETREDDSPWVFPTKGRSGEGRIVDPRKAWARVLKRAGIDDLRMHDLRRSLGSWQAAVGTSLAIIGKSLGHRDHKATQVYARLQLDPVRESVEKASAAMMETGEFVFDRNDARNHDV